MTALPAQEPRSHIVTNLSTNSSIPFTIYPAVLLILYKGSFYSGRGEGVDMVTRAFGKALEGAHIRISSKRATRKRIGASVLAVMMSLLLPVTAFAADWQAENWGDMEAAFGDPDSTVNILVLNNISNDSYGVLFGNAGSTYTIDGNGHTLTKFDFSSGGTVVINNAAVQGVSAGGTVDLTVNGDVQGRSGNPDEVNYSDPYDFSDGFLAVNAYGSASVTVNGDASGGNAYGTYGYGGYGILAQGNSTVVINGNVTGGSVSGDPNTIADPEDVALGGEGIISLPGTTVTVNGNVTGGSVNTDQARAGNGIGIVGTTDSETQLGIVTVTGTVTPGTSSTSTGTNGVAIYYAYQDQQEPGVPGEPQPFSEITPTPSIADAYWPTVIVHKLVINPDGIFFNGDGYLTAEEIAALGTATNYLVYGTSGTGGSVIASSDTALAGDTVTLYPTAASGYKLVGIWVNGELITPVNGVYSFVMSEGGADIISQFAPITSTTQASYQTGSTLAKTSDIAPTLLYSAMILVLLSSLLVAFGTFRSTKRAQAGAHVKK